MIIEKDKMLSVDEAIHVLDTLYNSKILDEALAESLYEIIYCLRNIKNGINAFEAPVEDMLTLNATIDKTAPGFVEKRREQLKLMDQYSFGYKYRYDKEDNERCYDE